jgi:hypothetical protein
MEKYRETDTAIAEAKDAYEKFIEDDRLWLAQLHHEMALHDMAQAKSDAEAEGRRRARLKAERRVVLLRGSPKVRPKEWQKA